MFGLRVEVRVAVRVRVRVAVGVAVRVRVRERFGVRVGVGVGVEDVPGVFETLESPGMVDENHVLAWSCRCKRQRDRWVATRVRVGLEVGRRVDRVTVQAQEPEWLAIPPMT